MSLIELTARRTDASVTPDKLDVQSEMIVRLETLLDLHTVGGVFTRIWLTTGEFVDVEEDRATIREVVN